MDILDLIEEELFQDNIDTEIENDRIFWTDNFGAENEVLRSQTARNGAIIAWWQMNGVGKETVKIKISNQVTLNWRPSINTMGLSSLGCSFIEIHKNFLILKYKDKHAERIFVFDYKKMKETEIHTRGKTKYLKLEGNKLIVNNLDMGTSKVILDSDGAELEIIDAKMM